MANLCKYCVHNDGWKSDDVECDLDCRGIKDYDENDEVLDCEDYEEDE